MAFRDWALLNMENTTSEKQTCTLIHIGRQCRFMHEAEALVESFL